MVHDVLESIVNAPVFADEEVAVDALAAAEARAELVRHRRPGQYPAVTLQAVSESIKACPT
jgi:hypothetical protein